MSSTSDAVVNNDDDVAPPRPDRTTMEGMIWNANHVLDMALHPDAKGIPRKLLSHCKGVALISVVEAGFMLSGSVGTGVILARRKNKNRPGQKDEWGPPSAIAMGGLGFGFIVGAEIKDVIVLLDDAALLKVLSSDKQIKLGGEMGVAIGPVGREVEASVDVGMDSRSAGLALTYTFSKGLFIEAAVQGAVLKGRTKENERFYGKKGITPSEILLGDEDGAPVVTVPEDKQEMVEDLHRKLEIMRRGKTRKLTEEELSKKEGQRVRAEAVGKAAKAEQGDDVEYIDAKAKATAEQETA